MSMPANTKEKLLARVDVSGDCWLWKGPTCKGGYGKTTLNYKTRSTHRVLYEMLVGPIPKGLHLDHLCRNRLCVNPKHLEPVTARENTRRSTNPITKLMNRNCCAHGHLYTKENTKIRKTNGARVCLICAKASRKRFYERHKK